MGLEYNYAGQRGLQSFYSKVASLALSFLVAKVRKEIVTSIKRNCTLPQGYLICPRLPS